MIRRFIAWLFQSAEPPEREKPQMIYRRGDFYVFRAALWYYVVSDGDGGPKVWEEFVMLSSAIADANERSARAEAKT